MKKGELTLDDLHELIESLKTDIAKKEGEIESQTNYLLKEFGVKNVTAAYKLLDKIEADISDKIRDRARLMKEAETYIEKFELR